MVALVQTTSQIHTSGLGEYVRNELFDNWAIQRQPVEAKWLRNENAFNAVSEGVWKVEEGAVWRSNTFIGMTKNKVLSAYSMVIDMLLQGGLLPFALTLSPWDQVVMEDMPEDQQDILQDNIDDMTGLIHQQILDCHGSRELMKCVMAGAKFGETYWKTYIHTVKRRGFKNINFAPQGMEQQQAQQYQRFEPFENEIKAPAFEYVSCWDMFRDMETDDMQDSQGCCQRSWTAPFALRKLIGQPHYIDEAIDRIINSHTRTSTSIKSDSLTPSRRKIKKPYNLIQKLEFWCRVPRKIVEEFEEKNKNSVRGTDLLEPENDGDDIEVGVCMAEDEVIRLVKIRQGSRPHGRVVWEINLDDDHGIGVADNVESVQTVLNGMVRAFEDNKKLSANIIIALKKALITNWTGEFKPGELLEISEEAKSATEAISQIIIQDVGDSLLTGIALMERYADEGSQLPKILQGNVAEKRKPDTLGEISILQANAGKYLGSVIKNYDEGLIEPVVSRFYEYNMLDPDVQKGKGNYIAKPLGFSSFQNKIIRLQKILQAITLTLQSPVLAQEVRLKELQSEVYKALDIDPQQVFKTKEEKAADAQAMAQAQQSQMDQAGVAMLAKAKADIETEVAKIATQHKAKLEEIEAQHMAKLEEIAATRIAQGPREAKA